MTDPRLSRLKWIPWLCKHQAQRAPTLGPCGSGHSGFGQEPEPRGMSRRWHRCMVPPCVPTPRGRRTGCGARPRGSLIQHRGIVCMACLLRRAVARLRSPPLSPRRYKFHATYSSPWTARLRSPCEAQGLRGSRGTPWRGLAVGQVSPPPRGGYRGDNIALILGQPPQGSQRREGCQSGEGPWEAVYVQTTDHASGRPIS